jgi:hypothetical protein
VVGAEKSFRDAFLRNGLDWSMLRKRLSCALLLVLAAVFALPAAKLLADDMTSTVVIRGSRIDVTFEPGEDGEKNSASKVTHADLLHWVQIAAEAVATYYERYPLPHVALRIIPVGGNGIRHGQTFGYDGGLIKIRVGNETPPAEFSQDWMLTHEMVHLAFPSVSEEHHWIEEGGAVYVEPIARIQAGQMSAAQMWADLVRDMPKGLPQEGDKGLDHTHTWGRTYWGGALFCMVADVEIRKQTHDKKGLQDALRGILNAGGDITHDWELEKALQTGDRATGTTVLMDLYTKWKDQPVQVDLPALWKELGIEPDGRTVRFVEDAPLAAVRRAITSPPAAQAAELRPSAVFAGRKITMAPRTAELN